jgi:hypothetical protein
MTIKKSGTQPSTRGPEDYFTGAVRIDPLFSPQEPARTAGNSVTFEPGARTAWHTHPLGQTLVVTAGSGWCSRKASPWRRSPRRRGLVSAQRATLARRHADHGGRTKYRHSGIAEFGMLVELLEKVSDEQ